jgi:hypothetical protein
MEQAAQRRPDIKVLRKKSNVVALYFNGELYHVQTLLEDVNKDLLEPQLGTRQFTIYEGGCYGRMETGEMDGFCTFFAPAQVQEYLQIPSYLYSTAVVQLLGSSDNYPSYPYNYNFVQETATKRIWFMADDMDNTIDSNGGTHFNPFETIYTEGDTQRHFTELVNDPAYGALYRSYLRELLPLLEPNVLKAAVAAKYAQVRDTLLASPQLPLGAEWYDYVYQTEISAWAEARFAYLSELLEQNNSNRPPTAVIAPLPVTIEAANADGITVQLNGASSTDPDNDPLTYSWSVDGQSVGAGATVSVTLDIGSHTIGLAVSDGRGGIGTAAASVQVLLPQLRVDYVSPSYLSRGTSEVLDVVGAGFSPQSLVYFSDFSIGSFYTSFSSGTNLRVFIEIYPFAPSGTYDLTVVNPDGRQVTLYQAITVQ